MKSSDFVEESHVSSSSSRELAKSTKFAIVHGSSYSWDVERCTTCMGPSILLKINKFLQELHYASRLYSMKAQLICLFVYLCHSQTCRDGGVYNWCDFDEWEYIYFCVLKFF